MMNFRSRFFSMAMLVLGLAALAFSGCSSGPMFATVTGVVTVNGKPAPKVHVEFHPDASKGTKGPSSYADTDDAGRYTLSYSTKDLEGEGAVVGWHKVVLTDSRLAESETGQGVPVRFGEAYGNVLSTPLNYEVQAGAQTIDIEASPK